MKILFIGDIIGRPGRHLIEDIFPSIRKKHEIDFAIANAENASGGVGVVLHNAEALLNAGIDFFTSGNHIFQNRHFEDLFDTLPLIVRPANYPENVPGRGYYIKELQDNPPVAIINLMGRTFMQAMDCPFITADKILDEIPDDIPIRIVDFHAEATSEKVALGLYLNGRVSAVLGTHTHVQTADERILSEGTAYITDVGMAGPVNSVIGIDPTAIIRRFLTSMPVKFTVAKGPAKIDYVVIDIDNTTGKALSIERFSITKQKYKKMD